METQSIIREAILRLRTLFDTFDLDGGGTLDNDELCRALRCLGLRPTDDEVTLTLNLTLT